MNKIVSLLFLDYLQLQIETSWLPQKRREGKGPRELVFIS